MPQCPLFLFFFSCKREESEAAIFEMLKDLVSRVKSEIEDEKREREEGQENLLALLEEAANKMHKAHKE